MFVLVAAHHRGAVPVDGRSPIDGELVIAPFVECTCDAPCTCDRAWLGVVSDGATPTAVIARRPGVNRAQIHAALASMIERNEWLDAHMGTRERDAHVARLIDEQLRSMSRILCEYPLGTVLLRDGDTVVALADNEAA